MGGANCLAEKKKIAEELGPERSQQRERQANERRCESTDAATRGTLIIMIGDPESGETPGAIALTKKKQTREGGGRATNINHPRSVKQEKKKKQKKKEKEKKKKEKKRKKKPGAFKA